VNSGLTSGKVSSNEDGAKAGRVELDMPEAEGVYPEPFDAIVMSGWCWPPEPGETVAAFVPDAEDQVEFADEVCYLGVQHDQEHPVADEFKDDYPKARGFKTKAGHLLFVNDKSGSEAVTVKEGKRSSELTLDKDQVLLKDGSGASVILKKTKEIVISNGLASITLSPSGTISIAPGSPLELAGGTHALLKGEAFNTDLGTYLTAQGTLADQSIAQFTALAAASTGLLAPLAAGFTALVAAWTAFKAAVVTFQAAPPNWLSSKSKTG
jgi:hypothetical protein